MKTFNQYINEECDEGIRDFFKSRPTQDIKGWKIKVHHGRHPDVPDVSSKGNILFAINPKTGEEHHVASGNLSKRDIEKFIKIYKLVESVMVCGDCFKWANEWNIEHHSKTAKHKVVHGIVTGGPNSKSFPHAWIEDKGKVYDTNIGDKGMPLKRFYKIFNARDTVKYTPTEATRNQIGKYGHHGPWDKSFDKWPTTK